jgi:hypothetical protein
MWWNDTIRTAVGKDEGVIKTLNDWGIGEVDLADYEDNKGKPLIGGYCEASYAIIPTSEDPIIFRLDNGKREARNMFQAKHWQAPQLPSRTWHSTLITQSPSV